MIVLRLVLILLVSWLSFPGCMVVHDPGPGYSAKESGPPPWAPAHGYRAKHHYYYYPDSRVYFDTGRGVYFYPSAGEWRVSASLPVGIHIDAHSYHTLDMDDDRPYRYQSAVEKRYPPGQMKKMGNGNGKGKGKKWD